LQKVLQIDIEKCVGCKTCEAACSLKNTGKVHPARSRVKVIAYEKRGEYHNYIPMVCQQCSTPLCMEACPTNAISKNQETGALLVDENACVGCKVCNMVCPIGGIGIDPVTNTAFKCELCEGDPECVKICDLQAISFVPMDKLDISIKRTKSEKISELFTLIARTREL
jgi:Fe-S-cluster-containing dehydrogenase component